MVQLPPEVLQVVIEHLHPTRDVRTLINVLQVSSTSWDLGARVLYRRIIIHAEAFHTLIGHCGDPFYPRTRRALGFVEFLGVDGTLHKTDIQRLAEICLPHVPLFPRVKSFHFDAGAAAGDSLEFPMPADRLVFDSPDVCLADEFNYAQLCLCLPAVHFGRITVHWEYADIFSAPHAPYALFPACPWRSFVNYALRGPELSYTPHDANLPARDLEEALERFPKLDAADEILAGRMAAQDLPRIQMLVPSGSLLHPHRMVDSLHFRLDRNHLERRVSARSTVEWVFYSKLDEVPPCPLCGEYEDRWLAGAHAPRWHVDRVCGAGHASLRPWPGRRQPSTCRTRRGRAR